MNKIDEIMGAAQDVADAMAELLQRPSGMREIIFNKEVDGLRNLIAAALADAERKGAETMRASVESALDDLPLPDGFFVSDIMGTINDAMPLPTGSQS